MNKAFLFYIIILSALASCVSQKKMLYFKEGKENIAIAQFKTDSTLKYRVQSGDILNVEISSTVASQQELLNQKFEEEKGGPLNSSNRPGYVVNNKGEIELPLIGKIMVSGLTVEEVNETVKKKLSEYLDYTFVKTTLVNFSITVLGEVREPGTKIIQSENITIFEALGNAGDITEFGNRANVRILRKFNTETKVITLDLSKAKIIGSQYYYLLPNDIIYVEPLKAKAFKINLTVASIALSMASIIFLVLRYTVFYNK